MKKITIALFLLFSCLHCFNVSAQSKNVKKISEKDIEASIDENIEKYKTALELNDFQAAILKTNLIKYGKKSLEILQSDAIIKQKEELLDILRQERRKELINFMSEEQIDLLEKIQKKQSKKVKKRDRPNYRAIKKERERQERQRRY